MKWVVVLVSCATGCGLLLDPTAPRPAADSDAGVEQDAARSDAGIEDSGVEQVDASTPPGTECDGPPTLQDAFGDDVLDALWVANSADSRIQEVDGVLQFGARPAGLTRTPRVRSRFAVPIVEEYVYVRVDELVASATQFTAELRLITSAGLEGASIKAGDGEIHGTVFGPGGVVLDFGLRDLDIARQRHWRIKETGGTLHVEVSADGNDWDLVASAPTPFRLEVAYMELSGGAMITVPETDLVRFDDFNLDAPLRPNRKFCAASSFLEPFYGTGLTAEWEFGSAGSCGSQRSTDGQLNFVLRAGAAMTNCESSTTRGFDLRNDEFVVQVDPLSPSSANAAFFVAVEDRFVRQARIELRTDEVWANGSDGSLEAAGPVDGVAYLRFRADATGLVQLSVSTDGVAWQNVGSTADLDLSAVRLVTGVRAFGEPVAEAQTFVIRGVNSFD